MSEKIYPQGVRCFKPTGNAPEFKIGTMVVNVDEFQDWIRTNPQYQSEYNGNQQVKFDVLKSRDGGFYLQVDNYKPNR